METEGNLQGKLQLHLVQFNIICSCRNCLHVFRSAKLKNESSDQENVKASLDIDIPAAGDARQIDVPEVALDHDIPAAEVSMVSGAAASQQNGIGLATHEQDIDLLSLRTDTGHFVQSATSEIHDSVRILKSMCL